MKANELMSELIALSSEKVEGTVDVCKVGDPDREVKKVAVCCFPCISVIKKAIEWGADMFIAHEPLFYDHYDRAAFDDNFSNSPIVKAKKELLVSSKMTAYRFHDYAHKAFPDMIAEGELRTSGLKGTFEKGSYFGVNKFTLEEAKTAKELAAELEKSLGIHHIRIAGNVDFKAKNLILAFGATGHIEEMINDENVDIILAGEIGEWASAEYVRDASELGYKKAILVMSHCGSEREGMKFCADYIIENHPELEVKYIESPEVYTYTD